MKLDLAALRSVEREKDISFDALVDAIETALVTAYRHTGDTAAPDARVQIDRSTGDVVVFAREFDGDGQLIREWDDTPEDFGRVAATTARQVIVQRLRDASSDVTYGEFAGHEREVVLGLVQHHEQRAGAKIVMVDLGKGFEAILPPAEQVPGERYEHGDRIRVCVGIRHALTARGIGDGVPYAPRVGTRFVRTRSARGGRSHGGDRGHRPGGGASHEDRRAHPGAGSQCQGGLHRPARSPRACRDGGAQRRKDRHRGLVR